MKARQLIPICADAENASSVEHMFGKFMSTNDLFDRIPQWLKSLHEMENEIRNAAVDRYDNAQGRGWFAQN
ncbi:MAG: hypothetical protein E6G91_08905 [Alphaproteobacteria bacterium]|nr:MAG: hypothetical protein E6G91_08905 [Alphaproteobacteria bacterium]